ncbi:phosphotransferase [Virgibacillus senegalensis]|uniref:phosphotransferase n=1 Tax=Virgibacillus senegalensis TaxID=1499679 RepID=UPI00069DB3CB|nr:phosphotransferase [Virgibacillus senegalensis]
MNKQTLLQILHQFVPDLSIESANVNHVGWDHDILFVNDELVFRFPKTEMVRRHTERELALLKALRKAGPVLLVPHCQELRDASGRIVAIYYPIVKGKSLSTIQPEDLLFNENNAKLLGKFLSTLHSISASQIESINFTIHTQDYWEKFYTAVQKGIFPHLPKEEVKLVSQTFTSFLERNREKTGTKTWIHGDLSADNIIFNEENGVINGIIDFTDSQYGDPAFDFAGFYWDYGPAFTRQVLHHYQGIEPSERLYERVRDFYGLQPVFHELLYQLKQGQPVNWPTALNKFKLLRK